MPFDADENEKGVTKNTSLDSGVSSRGSTYERKRSSLSLTTSKKQKLSCDVGATREVPLNISSTSDDECDPIEIAMEDVVVKYALVEEEVSMSVVAIGRVGAWRLAHYETLLSDNSVFKKISQEEEPFQPEQHEMIVIEIYKEGPALTYMRADVGTSCEVKNLKCQVLEKKIVRSNKRQVLNSVDGFATLLLLSPNHESATYTWEKKGDWVWEMLNVPSTCIVYVNSTGTYRCTVGDKSYYFEVAGHEIERAEADDLLVDMEMLEFGEVVGRGSFAEVHKGKWNGKKVALKRMRLPPGSDPSIVPKEVAVLRHLNHPNIVNLMAYSMNDEEVVLVMNFVEGASLECLLFSKKNAQELSVDQSLSVATQITEAVNYMHNHNPVVIHQDLKPHNVLVTADLSHVYVCDMGIAKVKQAAEATVTSMNKGPGTFPYMAPEMFLCSRRGPAVDIYSLGCLFIELFGRRRVWPGLDATAIMMKVVGSFDTPPQMPDTSHLDQPFGNLCSMLCQIDATKRPNIKEVLSMVKGLHKP